MAVYKNLRKVRRGSGLQLIRIDYAGVSRDSIGRFMKSLKERRRSDVEVLHVSEIDDTLLAEIEQSEYGVISK